MTISMQIIYNTLKYILNKAIPKSPGDLGLSRFISLAAINISGPPVAGWGRQKVIIKLYVNVNGSG
jgi:hypothetical protein